MAFASLSAGLPDADSPRQRAANFELFLRCLAEDGTEDDGTEMEIEE